MHWGKVSNPDAHLLGEKWMGVSVRHPHVNAAMADEHNIKDCRINKCPQQGRRIPRFSSYHLVSNDLEKENKPVGHKKREKSSLHPEGMM